MVKIGPRLLLFQARVIRQGILERSRRYQTTQTKMEVMRHLQPRRIQRKLESQVSQFSVQSTGLTDRRRRKTKKKTSEEGQPSATGIAEPSGVGKAKAKAKASPKPKPKATAKAKSSAKAKAKGKGKGKAKKQETKAKEKLEEHKRRRKHEKLEGEEAEEAKESEGGTADAETGVAPKDGKIANGDGEAVVATPPAKKIPKKSEGKPGPDKPGQSDKPVPARKRRARNGEGEKTFARRRCPTTEMGAAKYHAIRNAFTDNIKPFLTHFSHHEDFSLELLLSFGLLVSKNIILNLARPIHFQNCQITSLQFSLVIVFKCVLTCMPVCL